MPKSRTSSMLSLTASKPWRFSDRVVRTRRPLDLISCFWTSISRARTAKEVFSEMRADENLKPIPVTVLTTSKASQTFFAPTSSEPTASLQSPFTSPSSWMSSIRSRASG